MISVVLRFCSSKQYAREKVGAAAKDPACLACGAGLQSCGFARRQVVQLRGFKAAELQGGVAARLRGVRGCKAAGIPWDAKLHCTVAGRRRGCKTYSHRCHADASSEASARVNGKWP